MLSLLALTAPIYLLIAAGFVATRAGLFQRADMRVFGKYVIHLALPALLFNTLSQRQLSEIFNPVFLTAYVTGSLLALAAGIAWARRVKRLDASASAILGMGMCCSNSGFIGFPLVAMVLGAPTAGIALALAMLVENLVVIPLALALAEGGGGQGGTRAWRLAHAFGQSLRALARNPIIHGLALGMLFSITGWHLPEPVTRAIGLLAVSCSALALFVIGGSLVGVSIGAMWKEVSAVAAGKLLLHPLGVLLMLMVLPPIARELQVAAVLMASVPIMGIYTVLAQRHGHDGMAAAAQLGATVASFLTLPLVLWALGPVR